MQVGVDGTIFIRITNVKDSCYKVDQPLNSILNLAQVRYAQLQHSNPPHLNPPPP